MGAAESGAVRRFFARVGRRVWVRASAFAVAAMAFALVAGVVGAVTPFRLTIDLGQDSVGSLLQIIATAMLTATTFSVTAMITAYSSATTNATPRASQLLIADPTSQNALSTFVGAFVFAMVGIIALSTGYYTDQGRTILFFGTLVIIGIVVVTLLRWIAYLADFGRMADVIDRVEAAATDTVKAWANAPTLGAQRMISRPDGLSPVWAESSGYVTHIDVAALDRTAGDSGIRIFVDAMPGHMASRRQPLVWTTQPAGAEQQQRIRRAFRIEKHRTYEQDPRLGIIALSEIGSRALSPATNDPGTAIEVINALQRVFEAGLQTGEQAEVRYGSVLVRPPSLSDLLDDGFRPLARDGAGVIEVQVRLHRSLAAIAEVAPGERAAVAATARDAWTRARRELPPADVKALRAALHRESRRPRPGR